MNSPKPTNFRPRWFSDVKLRQVLDVEPWIGSIPDAFPKVTYRILPAGGRTSLNSRTLIELVENAQKVASFAAYDVVCGLNPEFADLRSIRQDIIKFSAITIEPFEEGSFVVPSRFEGESIDSTMPLGTRVTSDDLVKRFHEIFLAFESPVPVASVSLGALQAVDSITGALRKAEAELILTACDSALSPLKEIHTDETFRDNVKRTLTHRRPSSQQLETIEGKVTSLDIVKGKLLLSVPTLADRIRCSFPTTLHPKLLESLGRKVKLFGQIESKLGRPVNVYIQDSEFTDDE